MDELSEEDKLTVRSLMGHLPENIQLTHPRSSVLVRFSVSCHNPSRLPRSSRVMKASLFLSRTPSALSRRSFLVPMILFLNLLSTWYAYPSFFYLVLTSLLSSRVPSMMSRPRPSNSQKRWATSSLGSLFLGRWLSNKKCFRFHNYMT